MKKITKQFFVILLVLAISSDIFAQNVSFVGTQVSANENAGTITITANLTAGNLSASSVDIQLLSFASATPGTDFTTPASMTVNWPASSNNVTRTVTFTITNDLLHEAAEYFAVRFINPVNVNLPSSASNQFTAFILDDDKQAPVATQTIKLNHLGSYSNGPAGPNSAEIIAFDPASKRLFIANSLAAKLDIVNFSNPSALTPIATISMSTYGNINSVDVRNGIVAAAVENANPQLPGKVVFFDVNGTYLNAVNVGAMPDMITFNHSGTKVLVANEGEPNAAYTSDPEGSVSIIDISGGIASLTQAQVTTADFVAYNPQLAGLRAAGIRIFGPGATVAKDIEPEYITLSADDNTAWVSCQENNAIAVVDIATSTVTSLLPLGYKDHLLSGNGMDVSDQSAAVQIANWPVKGVYMPDAIASFSVGGQTYLITANEGDSRDYNGYSEVLRLNAASYVLDPATFPFANVMKANANLGRLNITRATGDTDGDGDFDEIHVFGSRSITIWNASTGARIWDSGDQLELITSKHPVFGAIFNASNAGPTNILKNRSDDKGPEPEGLATATIYGRVYAFVALERIGGCMVYDVTDPANPVFVDYKNTRTLASYGGDNGSEGIIYIKGSESPNGKPLVILANEVSSTVSVFEVEVTCPSYVADISVSPEYTVPGQQQYTIYRGYGPQSVNLTASVSPVFEAALSYSWSPVSATTGSITVSPLVSTLYTSTVTDEYGCSTTADRLINVIDIRDGNKNKVFICHNGHTQSVSVNAVPAHLAHGDQLGACGQNLVTTLSGLTAEEKAEALQLFPNPVNTNTAFISVNLAKAGQVKIVVTDLSGRSVLPIQMKGLNAGNNKVPVNISGLSNGRYFVQISYSGITTVLNMLVQH